MSQSHLDRSDSFGVVHFMKRPHRDPADVVNDPSMSTADKREMLADWASDRRAVRDHPALRRLDTGELVHIDAVLGALKRLDDIELRGGTWMTRRQLKRDRQANGHHVGWAFWKDDDDDDDDPPPCPAAAKPWKPRPLLDARAELMVA